MLYIYQEGSVQCLPRIPTVNYPTVQSPNNCTLSYQQNLPIRTLVPVGYVTLEPGMELNGNGTGSDISHNEKSLEYEPAMSDVSSEFFENEQRVMIERSDEEAEIDVENEEIHENHESEGQFINFMNIDTPATSRTSTPVSYPGVIMRNPEYEPRTEPKIKIEARNDTSSSDTTFEIVPKIEPEVDLELTPFTPNAELRVIEEHHQYKGHDPDQADREFQCEFCPKRFRRKEERKRHQNSHLNIRPHKCRICEKSFMRADHRNSHEKTHSKDKEYNCDICRKSFRRADEHKRHMLRQIHLRNVARLNNSKNRK
jgi:hypothetical protein